MQHFFLGSLGKRAPSQPTPASPGHTTREEQGRAGPSRGEQGRGERRREEESRGEPRREEERRAETVFEAPPLDPSDLKYHRFSLF